MQRRLLKETSAPLYASWLGYLLLVFFFILAPTFAGALGAATIRVPADVQTIQGAINAASNGDTVLVGPGAYVENISFIGKAITVTSEQGPAVTIISAGHSGGSVVTFGAGEGLSSLLIGFTITNGNSPVGGGGIGIRGASPKIINNIISGNRACPGSGILMLQSAAVIEDNEISANLPDSTCSQGNGGGILVFDAAGARITGNRIVSNSAASGGGWGGGILIAGASRVTIDNNLISANTAGFGGGIFMDGSTTAAEIVQNLIVNNSAINGGGVIWNVAGSRMISNTIAHNDVSAVPGSDVILNFAGTVGDALLVNNIIAAKQNPITLDCFNSLTQFGFISNNVFNPQGLPYGPGCGVQNGVKGSISLDPQFVNDTAGNFGLNLGSPSIDTGYNDIEGLPVTDFDGNPRISDGDSNGTAIIDMGAFEFGDSLPPVIATITASPNTLLQANHQMVPISIGISASDNSGQAVTCRIVSVGSNEAVQGLGDGDTAPDWLITGDLTVNLRAERSGKGTGRVYTMTVECVDVSGNRASSSVAVTVPRNN